MIFEDYCTRIKVIQTGKNGYKVLSNLELDTLNNLKLLVFEALEFV